VAEEEGATMTQPHPQRCETCRHYQTRFEYGNKKICTIIKERAPGSYQIGIPFHINIVGCASHSASGPVPEQMGDPWNCTDLGIECPDPEQDWCSWPCDKWLLCHDASIATKARADVLDELAEPTIRASEEAEQNGDYVSQTCYEDVLKWIAAIRQQEGKP
jgi:hypothetical protein